MAYPRNKKGFRILTVNGSPYRWRLSMGKNVGTVTLQGAESSGQQAIVTLPALRDPWLSLPQESIGTRPHITPAAIRQMIDEAFRRGWQPSQRLAPLKFEFAPGAHG